MTMIFKPPIPDYWFDSRLARFINRHPYLSWFITLIGAPLSILMTVSAITAAAAQIIWFFCGLA